MPKKSLAPVTSKYRNILEILQDPNMKSSLVSFVDEAVRCKEKMQYERENLKALCDNVTEELGIKPEIFRNYVDMVYKNDYVQRKDKFEELADLVDAVMRDAQIEYTPPAD